MMVDLGRKRDGIVPRGEIDKLLQEGRKFSIGDEVDVVVTKPEDAEGNLVVSVSQARQQKDWVTAEQLMASGELWEGEVIGYNRGGLLVQFGEVQAFVPASQVTDLPRGIPESERPNRLAAFRGRWMGFKVIEVDRRRRRLVLSQRRAQREFREKQKTQLLERLTEGQVRRGVVTALRDFGAFVDLGGADGLVHISELAWHRVKHPSEVLAVGQEVEVEILKVDRGGKRIGLSIKRRQVDPWTQLGEWFYVDQVVDGTITRVTSFGAFVHLGHGIEGLLHISQWAGETVLDEGQVIRVKILRLEPERQRVSLTLMREAPLAVEAEAEAEFTEALDFEVPSDEEDEAGTNGED